MQLNPLLFGFSLILSQILSCAVMKYDLAEPLAVTDSSQMFKQRLIEQFKVTALI